MNLMRGIDLKKIAEKMNGASGAESKVFNFDIFKLQRQFVLKQACLLLEKEEFTLLKKISKWLLQRL